MVEIDLRQHIKDYLDHHFNDGSYLRGLLDSIETTQLFDLGADLLLTSPGAMLDDVCVFIRDANFIPSEFSDKLLTSPVIAALEEVMFSEDYNNRYNAVYTLGKVGSKSSIVRMREALTTFMERDP